MNEKQEKDLIKAISIASGLMADCWEPEVKRLHSLLIKIWVGGLPEGYEPRDDFMISRVFDNRKNPK